MNINNETVNENNLEKIKNIIKEKEEAILKSQIIQSTLENKIKRLEKKREKNIDEKKCWIEIVFSYMIYDFIMISVLILFITQFINKFELLNILPKWKDIVNIYIGVTTISISGALITTKIESLVKKYFNRKILSKTTKKLKEKEEKILLEIEKQKLLKKEITNIINSTDKNIQFIEQDKPKNNNQEKDKKIELEQKEQMVKNPKMRIRKL